MKASKEALDETYLVLDQVCKIAQTPVTTQITHINKFFSHKKEIAALVEHREERIKQTIQEWQARVKELKSRSTTQPNQRKVLLQKELMQGEISDVKRRVNALSEQIEEHESVIKDLQDQIQEIEREQKKEESESSAQLPIAENHLKLYKSMCPIKFDASMFAPGASRSRKTAQAQQTQGEPTWDVVKGAAYLMTIGEVKPFEFIRQESEQARYAAGATPDASGSSGTQPVVLSRADLTNRIWDMLWEEHVANRQLCEQNKVLQALNDLTISEDL